MLIFYRALFHVKPFDWIRNILRAFSSPSLTNYSPRRLAVTTISCHLFQAYIIVSIMSLYVMLKFHSNFLCPLLSDPLLFRQLISFRDRPRDRSTRDLHTKIVFGESFNHLFRTWFNNCILCPLTELATDPMSVVPSLPPSKAFHISVEYTFFIIHCFQMTVTSFPLQSIRSMLMWQGVHGVQTSFLLTVSTVLFYYYLSIRRK